MNQIVLKEGQSVEDEDLYIKNIVTDGDARNFLYTRMKSSGWKDAELAKVFVNAQQAIAKFISPTSLSKKMNRLLCLGRVQSGKTAFFISTIALAFDNGYNVAYVIGGTKHNLLSQNVGRIRKDLGGGNDILIRNINNCDPQEIRNIIEANCKVILMVLKNKNEKSENNLASLEKLTKALCDIPSLIVDDEGDEHSPGNKKNTATGSKSILESVYSIQRGVYMSVTATPQSNLLISTLHGLSPDDCVLVEPGNGYTGASTFHDTVDNPLVEIVSDTEAFAEGVPLSFKNALKLFLIGAAIRVLRKEEGDDISHSMLVHPSSFTEIHKEVVYKIILELETLRKQLSNKLNIGYSEEKDKFKAFFEKEKTRFVNSANFDEIFEQICKNMARTKVFEVNRRPGNDGSDEGEDEFYLYKIYVGGAMLERGITLNNLSVTYIYRVSESSPVDSLLQRARWFGYKYKYLDLCRVYMPQTLAEQYVAASSHEEDLWETIRRFLDTDQSLKKMQRVFELNHNKLRITRASITKTIDAGSTRVGYKYDKEIDFGSKGDIVENNKLLNNYFENLIGKQEFAWGSSGLKHIYVDNVSMLDFIDKVISNYKFPTYAANVNARTFKIIKESIENNLMTDSFTLVKMRAGTNQFRDPVAGGKAIGELPQSYDYGTNYVGDRKLFKDRFSVQIHNVYTDKASPTQTIPMLAVSNPFDKVAISYVTGENFYED